MIKLSLGILGFVVGLAIGAFLIAAIKHALFILSLHY